MEKLQYLVYKPKIYSISTTTLSIGPTLMKSLPYLSKLQLVEDVIASLTFGLQACSQRKSE
jgi:hypothetical protein